MPPAQDATIFLAQQKGDFGAQVMAIQGLGGAVTCSKRGTSARLQQREKPVDQSQGRVFLARPAARRTHSRRIGSAPSLANAPGMGGKKTDAQQGRMGDGSVRCESDRPVRC